MSFGVIVLEIAEDEMAEASDWYDERSPGRGLLFLDAVYTEFDKLAERPFIGGHASFPFRRIEMPRYPFLIFYEVMDERIFIHAVHHTAREPQNYTSKA